MLIKGKEDINRSVDGDQVIIEIYSQNEWKAESDLLITNENEEDEKSISGNEKENENKIISGRVVGVSKRNWRSYCGSLDIVEEGAVANYVFDIE